MHLIEIESYVIRRKLVGNEGFQMCHDIFFRIIIGKFRFSMFALKNEVRFQQFIRFAHLLLKFLTKSFSANILNLNWPLIIPQ